VAQRDPDGFGLNDCEACMRNNGKLPRQSLGCGYEPTTDRVHLAVWQPPRGKRGYHGPDLTVCVGYTANLPEVTEAAVARAHWKHGAVVAACGGEMPSEDLLNSILIVESQYNAVEGWLMTPVKDGGGRE
jgi:hypothetical protein